MKSTPVDRAKAAWLYAQFVTSKTVDLKKCHAASPSSARARSRTRPSPTRAPELGGLVEFYRSPARVQWSPTGTNVPDYPKLAQLWWQNIGDAAAGAKTPQQAMDALCKAQEDVLERLERAGVQGDIGPKLNAGEDPKVWLDRPGAPKPEAGEREAEARTVDYDTLIKSWQK